MSYTLRMSDIVSAISQLNIPNVSIKNLEQIASSWTSTNKVLYPNPNQDGFITGFTMEWERDIADNITLRQASYTLNYRYLGTQIGDLSNFSKAYGDVAADLAVITNALVNAAQSILGSTQGQVTLGSISIGNKQDPAGNQFHGADFAINVIETQYT